MTQPKGRAACYLEGGSKGTTRKGGVTAGAQVLGDGSWDLTKVKAERNVKIQAMFWRQSGWHLK